MFGHVRGAFTDARQERTGRFELADGGTLFLDEIGNLPATQQAKLLRVLESGQFEPVGASRTRKVDVRWSSRDQCGPRAPVVSEGRFRQDLLFRINTVEIRIPPLRERAADILPLATAALVEPRAALSARPPRLRCRRGARAGAVRLARQRARAAQRRSSARCCWLPGKASRPRTCAWRRARRRRRRSRDMSLEDAERALIRAALATPRGQCQCRGAGTRPVAQRHVPAHGEAWNPHRNLGKRGMMPGQSLPAPTASRRVQWPFERRIAHARARARDSGHASRHRAGRAARAVARAAGCA